MKRTYVKLLTVAGLTGCFLFTSCRSAQETTARYEISKVEGNMITIDSTWDANPDKKATTVLKPYKDKVDAMMYEVIGTSEMKMDKGTPESLLSNLVASVLQEAAAQVLGKPADMGLVNMGGLRNILPKGDITVGAVFEILPFENSLCVLTMKGTDMKRLFKAIASLHGEGVSGIRLEINKKEEWLLSTIWQTETDAWMLSCKLKKGNARKMLLYADCFWTMYGSKRRKAKSLRRSWTDV